MKETICAISTPLGRGAISIVRLSGNRALEIMKDIFKSKSLDYQNIMPRYLYFGSLTLKNNLKEHCLAVYFKAPFSYTGEDMVEFQIHGGSYLSQSVLELLIKCGARLAENGEFTKRAFENGKISLDMAESIIDEINAESEGELKAALSLADGKLYKEITLLQNEITQMIAQIEATLDYPEEDFESSTKELIFNKIEEIQSKLNQLFEDGKNAKFIKNGINVALVGAPNVGKSSTLNALLGENRAIVTEIEGTTRDTLTESLIYKGIKINLIDTAGIRDSDDKVEKLGIEKSKTSIDKADVILFLLDGSKKMNVQDRQIKNLLKNKDNVITIINKNDLPRKLESQTDEILISALNEANINEIKEKIFTLVKAEKIDYSHTLVTSTRQQEIIENGMQLCNQILDNKNESMDIIAMLIKKLWNSLGKITGQCENENIIDLIFTKFCLGK